MSSSTKKIEVQYYAIMREERGLNQETLATKASTPLEIFQELKDKYRFSLSVDKIKVAVNDEFADWQAPLKSGDTLTFIPPVAGG